MAEKNHAGPGETGPHAEALNTFFHHLYEFLRKYLGVRGELSQDARRLAWMAAVYEFTTAFSNVFLNVFLFKGGGEWGTVVRYNLVSFCLIPPVFALGGWVARRGRRLFPYRVGLAFSTILFLAVLLLKGGARDQVSLLGLLNGLAIGFYFLGQHELTFGVTTPATRDSFFSLNQVYASSLRILSPFLASRLIYWFRTPETPDRGYGVIFAVALALYFALFIESFSFDQPSIRQPFRYVEALRAHWQPRLRPVMAAYYAWGLRNGLFWFIVSVLVYRASDKELTVGSYDILTQAIRLAMSLLLARWATSANRGKGLGWSAWIDVAGVTLLAWRLDVHTLLAFTALYATALALFQVTFTAYSFDIMDAAGGPTRTLENLAVREIPLGLGRVTGLLVFLVAQNRFGEGGLKAALWALGSAHVLVWWILTRWTSASVKAQVFSKSS